jgi:hypothetical protein
MRLIMKNHVALVEVVLVQLLDVVVGKIVVQLKNNR